MSSGSVAYSRWVQAPCRHSLNLQRGQHAGAGLGTGPHDPSGGQHDAVRCWLGLGSNDPLRCGLNSAHPTFAMRNLLQFAKSLRGCTMLPCFCIARTFYPADSVPPPFLWLGATVGWVWGTKFVAGLHCLFREAAFGSQLRSRPPDGGRMSSGSVVYSRHRVQAQCRHSLICGGASMPVLG